MTSGEPKRRSAATPTYLVFTREASLQALVAVLLAKRPARRTALAGHLAKQPLADPALPGTGAAFALTVLLAARRRLGPAGSRGAAGAGACSEAGIRRPDQGATPTLQPL